MAQRENGTPSILGILILMLAIGMILFVFFAFIRANPLEGEKPVAADKTKEKAPVDPNAVAEANRTPGKTLQPREPDPNTAKNINKLLADTNPKKPFSNLPPELKGGHTDDEIHAPKAVPVTGDEANPTQEPVHEVGTGTGEGAGMLKDASARIDEAPSDLYPDKAKAKVREGLKNAHRIFKVYTVYFEKGGASPTPKDKDGLNGALQEKSLVDSMGDPRTVFFVLGFADKSGDAGTNKKLSTARADAIVNMLKNDCGLLNLTYPVAVGGTELVSPANQNKNRAAEVWMVLP